jgi:hypothetical protein
MAGILVWHRMSARYPEAELRQRPFAGSLVHGDAPSPPVAAGPADEPRAPFVPRPSGIGTDTSWIGSLLPASAIAAPRR